MESEEALNDSIKLYETQLEQVKLAISSSEEGSNRDDLVTLHSDIEELLRLTKESLDTLKTTSYSENNEKQDDPLADEYALFKAELADLDDQAEEKSANDGSQSSGPEDDGVDIQDELSELMGSKCQAPYTSISGGTSYHNALVSSVEIADSVSDLEHIQVRVLFTNPTENGMVPCPFFLDNKCTYGEKHCRFSHGHLVQLPQLREYKEPDFKLIKPGCWVLAKMTEHLWQPAVVEDIVSDEVCTLKYEGRFQAVPVSDLIPLSSGTQEAEAGVGSDLSSDSELEIEKPGYDLSAMVEKSLTREPASHKLGTWEKYTKGIGSKLMEKMGYVVGTGLGKDGAGRLDPIEALILPAGKSLDHCMNLREAAGGSKDLFSAERIQKKLALRKLRQSRRLYLREKRQEKHDVFNVINKLSSGAGSSGVKGPELKQKLAATSGRELNVERFKIAEDIRQTERNIYILKDSLSRQKPGSIPHKKILAKLNSAQGHLSTLQNVDSRVAREQNFRESKKQLTTF